MTATRPGTTRSSTPWSSLSSVPSQKFAGTYRASRRAWRPPAIPHVHPVCAGITSGPSHDDRARYARANLRLATLGELVLDLGDDAAVSVVGDETGDLVGQTGGLAQLLRD